MNLLNSLLESYSQQGGAISHCSLCKSPGVRSSTCPLNKSAKNPNRKKHSLAAKKIKKGRALRTHARTALVDEKHNITSLIESFIVHKQYDKITDLIKHQQKSLKKHNDPRTRVVIRKLGKILATLQLRIANVPPLPLPTKARTRRSRRAKKKFECVDIMLDPNAAQAVLHIIDSVYASPQFVKIAETTDTDTVKQWVSDNVHKYI